MKKLVMLLLLPTLVLAQKPIFTTAKIKGATVYFNGAELSQTASVALPKGTSEIVFKNVADFLNESTVQIAVPSTVTVLSVQFTNNYLSEYDSDKNAPIIKTVRDSIQIVEKDIMKNNNLKDSEAKAIELLDKNQVVSGANSGLNLVELAKVVEYYKTKRTEFGNAYDSFEEKGKKLQERLNRLKTKLEINTKNEEKTSKGKLIVQVMNEIAGTVDFGINYIASNASWQPLYELRANSISEPLQMLYKAQVFQSTGIDWKKVKLTLSSGNPNQDNQAPLLQSWFLKYAEKSEEVYVGGYNSKKFKGRNDDKSVTNTLQNSFNYRDTVGYSTYTPGLEIANPQENQLNVSFDIDIPYDILSNGKAHSVALKEIQLPATYKYYAAPKLENEAFLLAEIGDYSKYNLLPGEANIIFEGLYVGKTAINPNQTSDTLNLSLGRDKKIAIKREKIIDKSGTKFMSSYKIQNFTYEITVRNNKKENAKLLLKDQYPLSSDKEIEIELTEKSDAKVNPETGFLTWDLNLKPNETRKIRISYKVKYPKDKTIDNL